MCGSRSLDEDKSLQALSDISPKWLGLVTMKNQIDELTQKLKTTEDLKNYYEKELNKLGVFPPQVTKVPLNNETSTKHPFLSQEWIKDQFQSPSTDTKIFKDQKVTLQDE